MERCPDSLLSSAEVGGAPVAIVNRTYFEFNRGALRSLSEIGVLYCTCGRCYLFLEWCRVAGEKRRPRIRSATIDLSNRGLYKACFHLEKP